MISLAKECSPAHVRDAWTNETGRVPGLWDRLVEVGVVGMLAPESAGGLGLTFVDLVLVLEETGRFAVPEPIVETAAWGVPLVGRTDLTIGGERVVGSLGRLRRRHLHRGRPFRARPDVDLAPRPSVDGARRLFEVQGGMPAAVDAGAVMAAYDRGVCGIAAQQCGLADRMLGMTADYVRERRQFGVPVGSFQAVKHHLANARIALEFARPLVYRAAASIAAGDPDTGVHVSMAKAKADAAAHQTAGRAPVPRRHRLHDRVRPAPLPEALLGAGAPGEQRAVPPRPRGPRDPVTTGTRGSEMAEAYIVDAVRTPGRTARRRRSRACTRPTSAPIRSAR